jgi:hypothetical protein
MSEEKPSPAPQPEDESAAASQPPENEPGNTVPWVPDDYSMNRHLYLPRRPNAAALDTNNQVLPPLPLRTAGRAVQYVDFGFTSAREYWDEVVLPAYERFQAEPSRGNAIPASLLAWHIQEWIWHDEHPGEDTRSKDYQPFQEKLFLDCPELQWIRDVADASKHRGLGRQKPKVEVREVKGTWPHNATPFTMRLDDGTRHDFADVLQRVIEFWRAKYFPYNEPHRRVPLTRGL